MSVNVKTSDGLKKIASNVSIAQANWNETDEGKNTYIKNKPEVLTTMEELDASTNDSDLVSVGVVKDLNNDLQIKTYTHPSQFGCESSFIPEICVAMPQHSTLAISVTNADNYIGANPDNIIPYAGGVLTITKSNSYVRVEFSGWSSGHMAYATLDLTVPTLTGWINVGAIGTIKTVTLTAQTVSSGTTGKALTSITLEKGRYIVIGHVRFSKNANGVRSMSVHGTSGWSSSHAITNALADFPTLLHYSFIQNVGDAPTTMYLNVWQTSGVDLTCDAGYLQAIKIS